MASKDEVVAEWLRCERSFWYFCLTYVRILSASGGGDIPFDPTWTYLRPIAEAFQAGEHVIVGKARQLGVSWLLAAYDSWLLTFHPDRRVLSISLGETESVELLKKVKHVLDSLPAHFRLRPVTTNETTVELSNRSAIKALPSTKNAGRSFNASLVQTDEFAFHPYAGENFASYRSAIADGGQHIIVTSGNGPDGLFASMWNDPNSGYRKFFLPWSSRPDRDQAWYDRELAAYTAGGDKHPLMFVRENPSTVEEMFTAFFGLVYEPFSPDRHMAPAEIPYEKCEWRVASVDPGQGDPAAATIIGQQPKSRRAHLYGPTFHQQGVTTAEDIYAYLVPWYRKAPLHAVLVDGAEGTLIATLNAWFLRDFGREPVTAANKERGVGIGLVAGRLKADLFTVDPSETGVRREFQTYRWKERRAAGESDPYSTSTPVDHHADRLDTIRYGLMWLAQYATPSGEPVSETPETPFQTPKTDVYVTQKDGWVDPLSRMRGISGGIMSTARKIGPDYSNRRAGPQWRRRVRT